MAPFYGRGSTASKLEPLRGGSLLFTTRFPEIPGTHFIDLGRMKGWLDLGATQWFWRLGIQSLYPRPLGIIWLWLQGYYSRKFSCWLLKALSLEIPSIVSTIKWIVILLLLFMWFIISIIIIVIQYYSLRQWLSFDYDGKGVRVLSFLFDYSKH